MINSAILPTHRVDNKFRVHIDRSLNLQAEREGVMHADLCTLMDLDRFVWAMLETDDEPFQVRLVKSMWRAPVSDMFHPPCAVLVDALRKAARPNASNLAALQLAKVMQTFQGSFDFPSHNHPAVSQFLFAPHIRLLLEMFHAHPLRDYIGRGRLDQQIGRGLIRADLYNDFVARFRQSMRAGGMLRRELHNWYLGSDQNVENLPAYLNGLFHKHGGLTVRHFLLFHSQERSNLVTAPVADQHDDLRRLRACRTKFLGCMRRNRSLFTDDPEYVWAILPSLKSGYVLHLTLLFSTTALRKVLDDRRVESEQATTALQDHEDEVGKYWVSGATEGLGSYHRSDKIIGLYGPEWVHGEVRVDDLGARERLTETLGYLARRRALVRLKNEPKGPYFGMPNRKS